MAEWVDRLSPEDKALLLAVNKLADDDWLRSPRKDFLFGFRLAVILANKNPEMIRKLQRLIHRIGADAHDFPVERFEVEDQLLYDHFIQTLDTMAKRMQAEDESSDPED